MLLGSLGLVCSPLVAQSVRVWSLCPPAAPQPHPLSSLHSCSALPRYPASALIVAAPNACLLFLLF